MSKPDDTYTKLAKSWGKEEPKPEVATRPRASRLPERKVDTPADRRNYANRLAGWPAPRVKG